MFEGIVRSGSRGDIGLDDISVMSGSCPTPKLCDFEVDRCSYSNDPGYPLQWYRGSNGTSSTGTGPSYDHTTRGDNGK